MDLNQFKKALETFYLDTKEIKPNNEAQERDVIITASKLYENLLSIYKTLDDKLLQNLKKR